MFLQNWEPSLPSCFRADSYEEAGTVARGTDKRMQGHRVVRKREVVKGSLKFIGLFINFQNKELAGAAMNSNIKRTPTPSISLKA